MDGRDLSKKEDLVGPGGGVAGSVDVKVDEKQLVMALPASEVFPAMAAAAAPVVAQVAEKRKRGRPSKGLAPKLPPQKWIKEEEEDVCFICFDGGSLVLCDRKGCPKAYHPACIKRDEEFFRSKAKWDCGWHICSICQRSSHYMCYTCTYSLCKKCSKEAEYVCVRGNKGFCSICMKTIMLIENKDAQNKESIQVDFDDKGSWEYLFKMYWVLLKSKLSLTLNELIEAKNPWRGTNGTHFKPQLPEKGVSAEVGDVPILSKSDEHAEQKILQELHEGGAVPMMSTSGEQSQQKVLKEQHQLPDQNSSLSEKLNSDKSKIMDGCMDWASKELLEFVAHMKNGDTSVLSQFDVQSLLMEYIKKNNLRDPHQKSQIICDLRLKTLFGKPCVGHIEMLKLLEYHFLIKEDTQNNAFIPAGIVGCASDIDAGHRNNAVNQSKKQRTRKKVEERAPQVNLNEYAAIDAHNIKLIFLRRSMMESLIDEVEKFHDKVVGSIVRIRVSGNDQKQDIYRLVQVVGTSKATEPYKIGDKTTDFMLEVLNLDKKDMMSIDGISNQEFSEDECRRLRQSIKCGLVKQMTVGDIQMKAMALQALRFDDWLVAEILRLSHLRDRANEKGHKKELRECVEKLQLLKTPEERQRKLSEVPEVHADPKMNPNYESGDDKGENEKKQDEVSRRTRNHPFRTKKNVKEDAAVSAQRVQQKRDGGGAANGFPKKENNVSVAGFSSVSGNLRSDSESAVIASVSAISPPTCNIEMEKIWHYRDPNGKVQGPFTMVQLQKWSTTGYFPANMRIWTKNEQDYSILLNDALTGKFHTNSALSQSISGQYRGVAMENCLSVGDSSMTLCSESRSNGAQEGIASESSNSVADALNKEKQSGNMQCSDLTKHATAYVDCPVFNNDHVERKSADRLNKVTELDVNDFNNADKNNISYDSALHHSPVIESEGKVSRNQNHECQSSGQTRLPVLLNLDLNDRDCTPALVTNPSESSEHKGDLNLVDLPSPTPNTDKDLEKQPNEQDSIFMDIQAAEMLRSLSACVPANGTRNSDVRRPMPNALDEDLPSPTPKSIDEKDLANPDQKQSYEDQAGQSSSQLEISTKDTCGSGANNQVVDEAQVQEAVGVWVGSPAPAEPSCKEWDFGLVPLSSLKPPEEVGDQVATSNVNNNHHPHSSQSHPSHHISNWLGVVNEPIEFSTLAEESVSDLLAEVDAMESQTGMPSPSSAMRCGDDMVDRNDCFSSIEELSPNTDAGKSDGVSSNPDNQFPSRLAEIGNPMGASQSQGSPFDPLKRSGGHPMTINEGETKSAIYPINIWDTSPDIHPQPSCNLNQVNSTSHNWSNVQGNMNMGWAGPPQAFANVGWRPSLGTPWANPNLILGAYNGNAGWESQQRFGSNRDWSFQGADLGYARPMWSRQQHGGGGGYSRPPPKGQRVCKFYESGHCKKGASCAYLHP